MGQTLGAFYALPDDERDLWVARWELATEKCGTCGRPRSECSNSKLLHYPNRRVCYVTMERMAAERRYEALHKERPYHDGTFGSWAKESSNSHPYRYDDGVTIFTADRDLDSADRFLSDPVARPGGVGVSEDEPSDAGPDEQGDGS